MLGSIFREDIKTIIEWQQIPWQNFKNSVVLVTGSTGLLGNALVHSLSAANDKYSLNLNIMAHGRNEKKAEAFAELKNVNFIKGDICGDLEKVFCGCNIDYIFHCTANTKSSDMALKPIEVITVNVDGTRNILELAQKMQVKSMLFFSSMEIYGKTEKAEVKETDLGYLNLQSSRSCYPESKRLCEVLCCAFYKEYKLPVKIARLAQTFGAGTSFDEKRVFAQFARSSMNIENIILHTNGTSIGNYCYLSDSVRAALLLLLTGENGEAYNVANPKSSTSIYNMARMVADDISDKKIDVIINIPKNSKELGYAADTNIVLNIDKIQNLGWNPTYDLPDMYRRMITDWRQNMQDDLNEVCK